MSISINLTGGGGSLKTTDALVRVLAPSGSSVSVTAGGSTKTLQPMTIDGDSTNNCYYDIVKSGSFTSTARSYAATSYGDSASGSLVVNSAKEYTLALSFWDGTLYNAGNKYTNQTGGYETFGPAFSSGHSSTYASDSNNVLSISFSGGSDSWPNCAWGTVREIDLSGYTTLHITATTASVTASGYGSKKFCAFGVMQGEKHSQFDSGTLTPSATEPNATLSVGDNTLDISAIDSGFIWFGASTRIDTGYSGSANIVVTKIWLT